MENEERCLDFILWGASQVGKTTALATYLCRNREKPEWLDRNAEDSYETIKLLSKVWTHLRKNLLPPATVSAQFYSLRHKDGRRIRFRDMRGGYAVNPFQEEEGKEDIDALKKAAGMIVFIEWPGQRIVHDNIAFETARLFAGGYPFTLAITKVECHLLPEQVSLFFHDPLGMAKDMNLSPSFIEILRLARPNRIFPLSVYGYSAEGLPAHYRDEFGRLVPQNIKPYGVDMPFDSLLNEVL